MLFEDKWRLNILHNSLAQIVEGGILSSYHIHIMLSCILFDQVLCVVLNIFEWKWVAKHFVNVN